MDNREYEIVEHSVIKNFKVFLVEIVHRAAHMHSDFEVAFLVGGSVIVTRDGIPMELNAPDFFIVNPLSSHEVRAEETALFLSIQVLPSFFHEHYPAMEQTEFGFCSGASTLDYPEKPYFSRILGFALSIARHYFTGEAGFSLYCAGKLNHLFYDLIQLMPHQTIPADRQKRRNQQHERIRRLSSYIHEHYDEKLLLSGLAERENLSMPYLSHFFKEYFRMSFQEYLMLLRSEKARQLLLLTDLNLLDICVECGFSDIKYLNRGFRKIYGISPKELRQKGMKTDGKNENSLLSLQRFLSPDEALAFLEKFSISQRSQTASSS